MLMESCCNLANKNSTRGRKWQEMEALSHLMVERLLNLHERRTSLQPTLEDVYLFISSSLVYEVVSQIVGQGNDFLKKRYSTNVI